MNKLLSIILILSLFLSQFQIGLLYAKEKKELEIQKQEVIISLNKTEVLVDKVVLKLDKKIKNDKGEKRLKEKQEEIKKYLAKTKEEITKKTNKKEIKTRLQKTKKVVLLKIISSVTKYENIEKNVPKELTKEKKEDAIETIQESIQGRNGGYSLIVKTKYKGVKLLKLLQKYDENVRVDFMYSVVNPPQPSPYRRGSSAELNYFEVFVSEGSLFRKEILEGIDAGDIPRKFLGIEIVQPEVFGIEESPNPLGDFSQPSPPNPLSQRERGDRTTYFYLEKLKQKTIEIGKKIKVGIIDTGIDYTHPDLRGNIGNGYDFINNDNYAEDEQGHGTHVSGILGARLNGKGIIGINPYVELIPLKICNKRGFCPSYAILRSLEYAKNNGIKILNMSLGGRGKVKENPICQGIKSLTEEGIIVVSASGNSNINADKFIPGGCDESITVGAVDKNLKRANFSNYGDKVDVSAPGVGVYSTYIGPHPLTPILRGEGWGGVSRGNYKTLDGTSMSAPHITGLVSVMKTFRPELDTGQIKEIFRQNSISIKTEENKKIGGLVDIEKAITFIESGKELVKKEANEKNAGNSDEHNDEHSKKEKKDPETSSGGQEELEEKESETIGEGQVEGGNEKEDNPSGHFSQRGKLKKNFWQNRIDISRLNERLRGKKDNNSDTQVDYISKQEKQERVQEMLNGEKEDKIVTNISPQNYETPIKINTNGDTSGQENNEEEIRKEMEDSMVEVKEKIEPRYDLPVLYPIETNPYPIPNPDPVFPNPVFPDIIDSRPLSMIIIPPIYAPPEEEPYRLGQEKNTQYNPDIEEEIENESLENSVERDEDIGIEEEISPTIGIQEPLLIPPFQEGDSSILIEESSELKETFVEAYIIDVGEEEEVNIEIAEMANIDDIFSQINDLENEESYKSWVEQVEKQRQEERNLEGQGTENININTFRELGIYQTQIDLLYHWGEHQVGIINGDGDYEIESSDPKIQVKLGTGGPANIQDIGIQTGVFTGSVSLWPNTIFVTANGVTEDYIDVKLTQKSDLQEVILKVKAHKTYEDIVLEQISGQTREFNNPNNFNIENLNPNLIEVTKNTQESKIILKTLNPGEAYFYIIYQSPYYSYKKYTYKVKVVITNPNTNPLELEIDNLRINQGERTSISITNGAGGYQVVSEDPNIEASIVEETNIEIYARGYTSNYINIRVNDSANQEKILKVSSKPKLRKYSYGIEVGERKFLNISNPSKYRYTWENNFDNNNNQIASIEYATQNGINGIQLNGLRQGETTLYVSHGVYTLLEIKIIVSAEKPLVINPEKKEIYKGNDAYFEIKNGESPYQMRNITNPTNTNLETEILTYTQNEKTYHYLKIRGINETNQYEQIQITDANNKQTTTQVRIVPQVQEEYCYIDIGELCKIEIDGINNYTLYNTNSERIFKTYVKGDNSLEISGEKKGEDYIYVKNNDNYIILKIYLKVSIPPEWDTIIMTYKIYKGRSKFISLNNLRQYEITVETPGIVELFKLDNHLKIKGIKKGQTNIYLKRGGNKRYKLSIDVEEPRELKLDGGDSIYLYWNKEEKIRILGGNGDYELKLHPENAIDGEIETIVNNGVVEYWVKLKLLSLSGVWNSYMMVIDEAREYAYKTIVPRANELVLDREDILVETREYETLRILNGNGDYEFYRNNDNILVEEIGGEENAYRVYGRSPGTSILEVRDGYGMRKSVRVTIEEALEIVEFEYTPTIDYGYLGGIYTETSGELRSIGYDYIYNENNYGRVILSNQEFTNLHSSILLAQCDDECNIYIRPFIVGENGETKYYNSSGSINGFHLTKYDGGNDFYLSNQILSRLDFGNVIPTSIQNSGLRTSNIGIGILGGLTIVGWVSVLLACSGDTITIECGLSIIPIEAIQATRYYGKTVKEIKKGVLWFNTKTKASSYLSHFGRSLGDTFLGVGRKLRNKFVNRFSSLSRDDLLLVERLNKKLTGDYINGLGDLVKKINTTTSFDSAKKLFIKGRLDKMNVNSRGEFVEAERVLQKNIDDTDKFIRSFEDGRYPRLLGSSDDGESYEVLRSELGLLKHKGSGVIKKLIGTEVNPVDFIIQNGKIKFGVSHSSQDMANAKNVDYAGEIYTDSNGRITSINNNSGHYKPALEGLTDAKELLDKYLGEVSHLFNNLR